MEVKDIDYKSRIMANGMKLVTAHIPGSPTTTSLIIFKVGSRNEENKHAGVSHFLEHIFFKGNKKYPTPGKVSEKIETLGGEHNAFTSKEYTGFYAKTASSYLDESLEWLGALLSNPLIKEKDVNKERGVIIEEINMYEDAPMMMVDNVFERLMFGKTPLGRDIIGEKKTLRATGAGELKSYYQKHYNPSSAILLIAGDLEKHNKDLEEKTVKYFNLKEKKNNKEEQKILPAEDRVRVKYKKTDQTHLYLGVKAYSFNDDKNYPLGLLSTIIGGGMSSWAFEEIREKRGLAYYIRSTNGLFLDTGYFAISAGLNNNKVELAVGEIIKLFERAKNKLVSPDELEKAKKQTFGRMILARETSDDIAFLLGKEILIRGKMVPFSEKIKILKGITREDIQRIAREILRPEEFKLGLIGPWKKKEEPRLVKMLKP